MSRGKSEPWAEHPAEKQIKDVAGHGALMDNIRGGQGWTKWQNHLSSSQLCLLSPGWEWWTAVGILWLCACTTHLPGHADGTSPSLLPHLNQNITDIAWTELSCWAHPSPGEEPTQSSWQSAMPGAAWELYLHCLKEIVIYSKGIRSLRSEILQLLYRWEKKDWQKINRSALYWNKFSFLFFFFLGTC